MPVTAVPLVPTPGPRGLPLVGNLPAFGRDPLGFLARLRDEFGDAVTWSLGPRRSLFISHPQHIAELLGAVERGFGILQIGWAFRQVTGESVILSEGADWRRKRALVQPTVRPRQVRGYAATMVDCARAASDRWRDGERIDVRAEMALITQRIVLRTLFGNDLGDQSRALGDAMGVAQEVVGAEVRGISLFLPAWVRTRNRRRLLTAVATVDAELHRLISERRASGSEAGDDLLGRLLAARDDQGRPLSAKEVRDEAVTLWAAGHETTSTTLTWTWYLLASSPSVRARLHDELHRVLGGRAPTIDDYERLTWTQQIIKEALRLYPPSWLIPAVARDGATLGGTPVPVGTTVWCSQWTTHRDPRWFPDPTAFRPERWEPDAPDVVPDHAWFPFGGGQRTCLGARFALVEAALVLATLAQHFHLDITPTQATPQVGLLLQLATPLRATLRRLPAASRGVCQASA
ncbi:cytochrome P450 [Streptantibioticus rubrisoli]|uniref:Cytochrome P450 n=1 Tax=Streptantibioticus rubrisoli TaxID=1387313 RepID=A0ABT1PB11_9ACTN|nr:cytochrome P450 [Streptantibioticus rubrisoli]MCQ4042559.1 cytochrome P450 [Streptantibioticus rubrisoli]